MIESVNVTGTLAGEMVTGRVAVMVCAMGDVLDVTLAEAERLKVVFVSDAGTVTSKVRPVASDGLAAMVTVESSAVRVGLVRTGVELSDAVALRRKMPFPPAVMAAIRCLLNAKSLSNV